MSCHGCSSGRGCSTSANSLPGGCKNNGACGAGGCNKLNVFDWLANMQLPSGQQAFDCVEVRFKNSRKEFFRNVNNLTLKVGDVIAVEGSPGHDIGVVSATGEIVRLQMKKKNVSAEQPDLKKIYRMARPNDIDKWKEAQGLEYNTMHRARTLAVNLKLQMKISDVEYQGDRTKATFYYTAEERVDFRELIKVMADEFKVRIEMRQIGSRQEASRLGGIGACGRELCCSTWLTDFRTVSTSAARYQQLSLNPLKLAGQCGKLKCCLNYELDSYMDAVKDFPETNPLLETQKGKAFHQKTDIFKRMMWYSYQENPGMFIALSVDKVKEIQNMNKQGIVPAELVDEAREVPAKKEPDYENVVGQDSLTRFDKKKQHQHKKKPQHQGGNRNNNPNPNNQSNPNNQNNQRRNNQHRRNNNQRRNNNNNNQQNNPHGKGA